MFTLVYIKNCVVYSRWNSHEKESGSIATMDYQSRWHVYGSVPFTTVHTCCTP